MDSSPNSNNLNNSHIITSFAQLGHHLLILVPAVLVVIFALSLIERHDKANQDHYNQILLQQQATVKNLEDSLTKNEAQWQQVEQSLLAQNQALTVAISRRDQQIKQTIQKDSSLSITDAALKLSQQTKAVSGEISTSGDNLLIDLPISRQIIANLDLLPSVQADLTDTKEQLNNQNTIISNLRQNLSDEQDLTHSLDQQVVDQKKAYDAQIKTLKAQHRKGIVKAFVCGFIAGYIAGKVL